MQKESIQTFDRKKAAEYLGVSVITLDRAISKRTIACFRIGRRVLFSKDHLDTFLSKNEVQAKTKSDYRSMSERM